MTTMRESTAWWQTAPNPPCAADWCEGDHAPDEFTEGGGLLCQKLVGAAADRWEVWAAKYSHVVGDGTTEAVVVEPANIQVSSSMDDILTPDEAVALALAITEAAQIVRQDRAR